MKGNQDMTRKQTIIEKPIVYHSEVEQCFDALAADCGYKPADLRILSEQAIMNRHDQATMLDQARDYHPDVWQLGIGMAQVIYTVETHAVVIRGYCWDIHGEVRDDFACGGYFHDSDWQVKP